MGFISALTELAAATANLHPDHRARLGDLIEVDPRPGAGRTTGQSSEERSTAPRSSTSDETTLSAASSFTSTTPPASSRTSIS